MVDANGEGTVRQPSLRNGAYQRADRLERPTSKPTARTKGQRHASLLLKAARGEQLSPAELAELTKTPLRTVQSRLKKAARLDSEMLAGDEIADILETDIVDESGNPIGKYREHPEVVAFLNEHRRAK